MSVTERHMGLGAWTLTLRTDTPLSVLNQVDLVSKAFGHVIVTPTHSDADAVGGNGLLTLARYTGMLRARPSQYELAGAGLAAWLGDEDGKGDVLDSALTKSAGTFVQWITDLRPSSLDAGTYNTVAGSLNATYQWVSRREALDAVCDYFGAEWRVNPNGSLDGGTEAQLFTTTPIAVVQKRSGGRDLNVVGIRAHLDVAKDYEDYTTAVKLLANGVVGTANISPATTFRDLNGNLVEFTRIVDSSNTTAGNETAVAQAQLNRFTSLRRAVSLSSDAYDIGGDIAVGDTIYVWDPDLDLVDTANQVQYRGQLIFPIKLRVLGYTWPIRRGMGVYFRAPTTAGEITDLTDWVEWETGDTTIEVGAKPRASDSSTGSPGNADPYAQLPVAWQSYTPTWSGSGGTPSLGNGTLQGRYVVHGQTLHLAIKLIWGSTTTGNASTSWLFTIPSGLTLYGPAVRYQVVPALLWQSSSGNHLMRPARNGSATQLAISANEVNNNVGSTQPWTWTTSDELLIEGALEIA